MAYYAPGQVIPSKLHLYLGKWEPQGIFRFLDLPGEIRNKIYDLVFDECLVNVQLGHLRRSCNEIIDRSFAGGFRKQLQRKCDTTSPPRTQRLGDKQPDRQIRQNSPKSDSKQQNQTSQLLQDQICTEPQKPSKYQYRNQKFKKRGPKRLSHTAFPPPGSNQDDTSSDYRLQFNFVLVNRQLYSEALCVLYAKASFRFVTHQAINRFLLITPLRALQAIQGLDVSYATYPEPELTAQRRFKVLDDKNWARTCKLMRERMTDLKRLRLHLEVNEWPSQLGINEEWAQSILSMSGNGLHCVDIVLVHHAFSEERLIEAARNLEIAMMSREGRIARFAQEKKIMKAKKEEKKKIESKARRVLVIKMDNTPATEKVQKV